MDLDRINIHHPHDLAHWAERLDVTPEQLRAAVLRVGCDPVAVMKFLGVPVRGPLVQRLEDLGFEVWPDGTVSERYTQAPTTTYVAGDSTVKLDGPYSIEHLEALVAYMRDTKGKGAAAARFAPELLQQYGEQILDNMKHWKMSAHDAAWASVSVAYLTHQIDPADQDIFHAALLQFLAPQIDQLAVQIS